MNKYVALLLWLTAACVDSGVSLADEDAALLAEARQRKSSFVQDLRTVVNIDSGTTDEKGLARVQAFLAKRLKGLGAKVEIIAVPPAVGKVVLGTLLGSGSKNIMLMIHYDTVFEAGEAAKRPFKLEGNKAFGPGVADAKGGALIILHALEIMRKRGFKGYRTLTVLFNADEEKSSLGSRGLIRDLSARQDAVLCYEPPEADRVTVATNGIAWVYLQVKGVASHAGSAPERGRNAAVELSSQILQLQNLGDPAKGTTVNWTVMEAGNANHVNIIPGEARAIADMRMSDAAEIERVRQDANAIVQNKLIRETEVQVEVESRRPPFAKNPASDALAGLANQIYQEIGKTIEPVAMRYGTDAGFAYEPNGGKPAILDGMGIVGDRIHSSDEWADLDSVAPRLYLTVRMLESLAR